MLEILDKGGVLVYPILLCSIMGTTIFFERLIRFRKIRRTQMKPEESLRLLQQGRFQQAINLLRESNNDFSLNNRILLDALSLDDPDHETLETVLAHSVEHEINHLSRYMNTLAILGNTAPLLGLLGTVFGMIKAFAVVEKLGGSVNAAVLAGGIWEAMLTTALGLSAAIPLIFFHNHLQNQLNSIQESLEDTAIFFVKAWSKWHRMKT